MKNKKQLLTLFFLIFTSFYDCYSQKMSTNLGTSPQGEGNHEGCMSLQFLSSINQTPITTIRKWAETQDQADMIDRFVSIGAQYAIARFEITPNVAYYNDGISPNAFAYFNGSDDGIIRIGGKLVQAEFQLWRQDFFEQCRKLGLDPYQLLNAGKAGGTYSIDAIIAHECAHILQAKMGVARNSRNNELQADFLAGWHMAEYIRVFQSEAKKFRILEDGIRAFYSRGDYQFNSPQHHGTPEQRYNAFIEGFKLGDVSLITAWNKSMEYRRKLGG
ncbi:neutral zinc metallopeptidase [Roseivirga echinicomitans]|uniref:Uncharacterized protein n=1 Tax=Roseivirga echinicomitans TaxID=296218 RepID=A0A150XDH3_9BACT|nr:hypothetical protein [Roseivirga echinicomitans]KYG76763.1 hypothetical protein AWN68_06980 [Roseivirga echinicomitans]